MKRVLVVKMSSLGDVIHTLPALSDAAAARPGIRFDWVVEEAFAEIPGWHPSVDTVIPVALRRWRKKPLRDFRGSEWRRARSALARQRYDAVIDAQGLIKSAFIARLVKAPRYGLDRKSAREGLASAVYHHRIAVPRDMHAVERTRQLFSRSLAYPVPTGPVNYGVDFSAPAAPDVPTLLFLHGTARQEKLWPEAHWRELLTLTVAAGYRVWLPWGSEGERERALRIVGDTDSAEVLPPMSLSELAHRMLQARAAVAVDTGLGHLCAALDVPAVSLYGPTRTSLVGTCGANQEHIESPLAGHGGIAAPAAMAAISPTTVWQALADLVDGED